MYEKGNCYFADWRDRKGKRKRKSFSTSEEATAYEAAQKETARPKQGGSSGSQSRRPCTDSPSKGSKTQPQAGRRKSSSVSAVSSGQVSSTKGTSITSAPKRSPRNRPAIEASGPEQFVASFGTYRRISERKTSRITLSVRHARTLGTSPQPRQKGKS